MYGAKSILQNISWGAHSRGETWGQILQLILLTPKESGQICFVLTDQLDY